MFHIRYMGEYHSDEQLIQDKKLPKGSIQFGIVTSLTKEFVRGFFYLLPILILMILLIYWKVKDISYHLAMGIPIIVSFFVVFGLVYLLTFVHEVIHALLFPSEANKTIWKSKKDGAYFVYCDEPISRSRFFIMSLSPLFVLGIIPFMIWLFLPVMVPMPYYLIFPFTFWLMSFVSIGDVANLYYVIKEVPKGAKLFNYGFLDSYYIKNK